MKNKKGNVAVIAIIIIIAIVTVGLMVWFMKDKSQTPAEQVVKTKTPVTQQPATTKTVDETALWQTYSNTKLGFEIKYPADWTHTIQDIDTDYIDGFFFLKKGNENIANSANPALEIGSVAEELKLRSLIMEAKNFKDFNPKNYVTSGFSIYGEEIISWEEKKTKQGRPAYFYVVKLVDNGIKVEGKITTLEKPEVKEGVIFINNNTRKITMLEREYKMDRSKISDDLRNTLQKMALTFIDTQE